MVDVAVKSEAAWVCQAQGHHLANVLLHVNDDEEELSQSNWGDPVLLEQTEEGSPCVLTLSCSGSSPSAISRLLLVSEARMMEVYSQTGEYCGTVRGERDSSVQPDGSDRGPFYRKQLILEDPSSSFDVKLLSLGGRSSVLVCRFVVGLQPLQLCPIHGPAINMQQVQSLVEEMGTSLSPGAQNLMDMVHLQQKNQSGSLDGLLPFLLGGAFPALARGGVISPGVVRNEPQAAQSKPPHSSVGPADEVPPAQNGATSDGSTTSSPADMPMSYVNNRNTRRPVSPTQLADMMSHLLKGPGRSQASSPVAEFLPVLQSVCGQVTQLRLDDAAAAAEKEKTMRNGSWEFDSAMERRLEEMEKRLLEHVDRRLDALEQKLEKALLSALPLVALNKGTVSSSAGGAPPTGPSALSPEPTT